MSLSKDNTHVFIVRIWWEPREIEGAIPKWRGMIEHVPGDKRRYLEDLDEIIAFISPYVGQTGTKPSIRWHMKELLRRLRLHLKI